MHRALSVRSRDRGHRFGRGRLSACNRRRSLRGDPWAARSSAYRCSGADDLKRRSATLGAAIQRAVCSRKQPGGHPCERLPGRHVRGGGSHGGRPTHGRHGHGVRIPARYHRALGIGPHQHRPGPDPRAAGRLAEAEQAVEQALNLSRRGVARVETASTRCSPSLAFAGRSAIFPAPDRRWSKRRDSSSPIGPGIVAALLAPGRRPGTTAFAR